MAQRRECCARRASDQVDGGEDRHAQRHAQVVLPGEGPLHRGQQIQAAQARLIDRGEGLGAGLVQIRRASRSRAEEI
jgi:hypothetical protein